MPQSGSPTPDIQDAFRAHPELHDICGKVLGAVSQAGLSNRVYRLETERGAFFLRLPRAETAGMVDRDDEAGNISRAAGLGVALKPLFCEPAAGILLTRAVETISAAPDAVATRLGDVLGRLHASKAVFRGKLDPDRVIQSQKSTLAEDGCAGADVALLDRVLQMLEPHERPDHDRVAVPSHGDPSPGNCLMASDRLWLIDWEYSAMADPAWDLAYASLEHAFSVAEEGRFLKAYRHRAGDRLCPSTRDLEIMKAKCDVVSALWGLEQLRQESDKTDFLAFAHARRDRALATARRITG
ncbi:phosphotransferase [Roseibium sp. MMSF_3412]|uniref:phosphotransferase n=1 Tax=Roseibium sp. MMSF_3412 TaxID=3046712 RepID=UPI00273E39D5|nr:phosphotransferase [Roseibium sp. MMSF_3412]